MTSVNIIKIQICDCWGVFNLGTNIRLLGRFSKLLQHELMLFLHLLIFLLLGPVILDPPPALVPPSGEVLIALVNQSQDNALGFSDLVRLSPDEELLLWSQLPALNSGSRFCKITYVNVINLADRRLNMDMESATDLVKGPFRLRKTRTALSLRREWVAFQ